MFLDECEGMFESRDTQGSPVASLLPEIEKFEGILVLATNRPYDLDEAMYRRISLAVEFQPPVSAAAL